MNYKKINDYLKEHKENISVMEDRLNTCEEEIKDIKHTRFNRHLSFSVYTGGMGLLIFSTIYSESARMVFNYITSNNISYEIVPIVLTMLNIPFVIKMVNREGTRGKVELKNLKILKRKKEELKEQLDEALDRQHYYDTSFDPIVVKYEDYPIYKSSEQVTIPTEVEQKEMKLTLSRKLK